MRYGIIVVALLTATAASAQTIVSTHPPLSPTAAVQVLRASHSPADLTDAHFASGEGPRVVIVGPPGAIAPWAWPPEPHAPIAPLSNQPSVYAPAFPYGYGYGATLNPWAMYTP